MSQSEKWMLKFDALGGGGLKSASQKYEPIRKVYISGI